MDKKTIMIINNEILLITALVHNSPLRDKIVAHLQKIKELVNNEANL